VANLIDAVLAPSEAGDKALRAAVSADGPTTAQEKLEAIRAIVDE
jgi:hypothetical protein